MSLRYLWLSCVFFLQVVLFAVYSEAQEVAFEIDKQFEGVKEVNIDGDFCSVKIKGTDNRIANLKGVLKSNDNPEVYKVNADVKDGVLSVHVIKPKSWKSHWGELDFVLPNDIKLNVKTQSGKISISDLSKASIDIESKSGHVLMDNVEGTVHTVSPAGDLNLKNVKGTVNSRSKSGTVIIDNAQGTYTLGSSDGNYLIKNLKGTLITEGGSGNQEIENVEGDIKLKSTSGDLKVSLCKGNIVTRTFEGNQKIFQTEGTYQVQSSTGQLTGNRMKFDSSSSFTATEGNIKVQVANKTNIAYELESENSFLRAMNKSKKKKLKVGKGDIIISGISTTGSQAYY